MPHVPAFVIRAYGETESVVVNTDEKDSWRKAIGINMIEFLKIGEVVFKGGDTTLDVSAVVDEDALMKSPRPPMNLKAPFVLGDLALVFTVVPHNQEELYVDPLSVLSEDAILDMTLKWSYAQIRRHSVPAESFMKMKPADFAEYQKEIRSIFDFTKLPFDFDKIPQM
jgi:hypothetical protein